MNREKVEERIFGRKDYQAYMGEAYARRLLDILDEGEIDINDDALINYLLIPEAGIGTSIESAKEDLRHKQRMKAELKKSVFNPIRKFADWTKISTIFQILEFAVVGVGIGLLAIYLPHKWEIEKELQQEAEVIVSEPTNLGVIRSEEYNAWKKALKLTFPDPTIKK